MEEVRHGNDARPVVARELAVWAAPGTKESAPAVQVLDPETIELVCLVEHGELAHVAQELYDSSLRAVGTEIDALFNSSDTFRKVKVVFAVLCVIAAHQSIVGECLRRGVSHVVAMHNALQWVGLAFIYKSHSIYFTWEQEPCGDRHQSPGRAT